MSVFTGLRRSCYGNYQGQCLGISASSAFPFLQIPECCPSSLQGVHRVLKCIKHFEINLVSIKVTFFMACYSLAVWDFCNDIFHNILQRRIKGPHVKCMFLNNFFKLEFLNDSEVNDNLP